MTIQRLVKETKQEIHLSVIPNPGSSGIPFFTCSSTTLLVMLTPPLGLCRQQKDFIRIPLLSGLEVIPEAILLRRRWGDVVAT